MSKDFNTGEPLGYFLTWTTYGTWLPGDDRGWRKRDEPESQPPNALFRSMAEADMTEPAFILSVTDRATVKETIQKHCHIRGWPLHVANPRTNHVHVVVTAPGYKPETVRDQLKAWCTRNLKETYSDREKFWTEGASRRYLNTEEELEAAIMYASEAQDRKDRDQ
ncbi:hypothetical protein LF1_05030 [Rubripirellula obstinata]|uniref:Transposase IS200-like domain-containing protein n=1 Tax=Rubripirellula obstinata TaxID=406547 RepID=A0A5B1CCR7_9BACT|nr:transposase [Rubripirellula obstinata]KAA1258012.1 hypothetical protein LF1_05030 [Rubripirellula obstinata]